jgi:Domain of unknown function (DUF6468)
MGDMEWVLEIALVSLLAATLFHAIRLERALGVLKRDRSVLEELISGFNASTQQAEAGVDRLRHAADGAGRQLARQTEMASSLKDDLTFLLERGERLADRMDHLIRMSRPLAVESPRFVMAEQESADAPRLRSQAERDLLKALRMTR